MWWEGEAQVSSALLGMGGAGAGVQASKRHLGDAACGKGVVVILKLSRGEAGPCCQGQRLSIPTGPALGQEVTCLNTNTIRV